MADPDFTKLTEADVLAIIAGSPAGNGAFAADENTLITPSTPIVLDEEAGDEAALTLDYTTNKAAGNDTGLLINQTDTLSPGTSKLLDLQVGGASKFSVDNAGAVSIGAGIQHTAAGGGSVARTIVAGVQRLDVGATAIGISSGASIAWNSSNYASLSGDLLLNRDAANTLAQRNGVNAQTYNIYNTYTSATSYERGFLKWDADTFVIGTEAGSGGGTVRGIQLSGDVTSTGDVNGASPTEMGYLSGVTSNIQTQLDAAGGGAFGADANTLITPSTPIVLDEATGDEAALTLDYTTNKAAGNDTGLLINQTDTLSPGTSNLMDLQVGGVSKFSINHFGVSNGFALNCQYLATSTVTPSAPFGTYMDRFALRLNSAAELGWTASTTAFTTRDLSLWRDAANTLAQRNGVNAQTFNIYNTYTGATNYERAHIGWNDTADTFVIGTEAGSAGGTVRDIQLKIGADRVFGVDTTLLNTSVGSAALSDALLTGAGNTAAGYHALNQNTTGDGNSAMGYNALGSNTTGTYNNGSGYRPLFSNTEGDYNSAIGYRPLFSNTHGSGNNAMGYNALGSNIDGNYNNAIGYSALYNNVSGSYGIALGFNALLNSTASGNIGIGASSGSSLSSGAYNLAAGYQALVNADGNYNVVLGWRSARYQSGGTVNLTSAEDSIFIGKSTKGVEAATNQIVIGDSAEGLGSNTVVLGADSIVTTALKGNVGITSTWNDGATAFNGIKLDVTDTASAAGSNLLDLQAGGSSKFKVSNTGALTLPAGIPTEPALVIGPSSNGGFSTSGSTLSYAIGGTSRLSLDSGDALWLRRNTSNLALGSSADTRLYRDAAGILAQRNGVNAQTYNIYNTYTSATDFERAHMGWNDAADNFVIGTEAAGTGVLRNIKLTGGNIDVAPGAGAALRLGANTSITWQLTTGHVFGPTGNNVRDLASSSLRVRSLYLGTSLDIAQGTLTDDAQALNITSTWNDAADTFTLIKADVTDTASAAGSKLMDLQVGGTSKFSVGATGELVQADAVSGQSSGLTLGNGLAVGSAYPYIKLKTNWGDRTITSWGGGFQFNAGVSANGSLQIRGADSALFWSNSTNNVRDLALYKDADDTLAQKNGVNAQTFNIYNTYTDASNYERGHIGWNADRFVIGNTSAGTGVNRYMQLGSGVNGSILLLDFPDNTGMVFEQGGIAKLSMRPSGLESASSVYYDLGNTGLNRWGVAYTQALDVDQGTLTDDAQALNIVSMWNDAADAFTLIKADVTDTASAAGSNLLDLQVGGVSKLSVSKGGDVSVSGSIAATGTIKATPTTVGALPAASTAGAGARTFVTNSANSLSSHHGQTVTGGGTDFVPVYSDGTTWRVG
jgi:hypothetical protein